MSRWHHRIWRVFIQPREGWLLHCSASFLRLPRFGSRQSSSHFEHDDQPKVATEICLVDGSSGDRASDSTIVRLLTQDVLERPQQAHPGDEVFTEAVNATLQDERAKAHTEAAQEPHMFFELEEVTRWIQNISIHKASLRFPRAAIHNDQPLGRRLCWLLLNLFLALGVVPSAWMREISFIRKRGPQIVTDFKNLRPISYTDELQTLFDLAWLQKCRSILEAYVGSEQSGGRYDSVLISLGILIALQTRRNLSLPTFCLKADLLQGYDLAWKSAILLHTRWAGIKGSLWLCLDSSLQQDFPCPLRATCGACRTGAGSRTWSRWAKGCAPFWSNGAGDPRPTQATYHWHCYWIALAPPQQATSWQPLLW